AAADRGDGAARPAESLANVERRINSGRRVTDRAGEPEPPWADPPEPAVGRAGGQVTRSRVVEPLVRQEAGGRVGGIGRAADEPGRVEWRLSTVPSRVISPGLTGLGLRGGGSRIAVRRPPDLALEDVNLFAFRPDGDRVLGPEVNEACGRGAKVERGGRLVGLEHHLAVEDGGRAGAVDPEPGRALDQQIGP